MLPEYYPLTEPAWYMQSLWTCDTFGGPSSLPGLPTPHGMWELLEPVLYISLEKSINISSCEGKHFFPYARWKNGDKFEVFIIPK